MTDTIGYKLWFDVGFKRYTTVGNLVPIGNKLWFDVGIKIYNAAYMTAGSVKRTVSPFSLHYPICWCFSDSFEEIFIFFIQYFPNTIFATSFSDN